MAIISIFVTNLGAYNRGELRGEWVNLPIEQEELAEVLNRIGIGPVDEEYFITDYETDIDGFTVEEYDSIKELNAIAEMIDALSDEELEVLSALMEHSCEPYEWDDMLETIRDGEYCYYPGAKDMSDVAYDYMEDIVNMRDIPPIIRYSIDYGRAGDLLDSGGTFIPTANGYVELW